MTRRIVATLVLTVAWMSSVHPRPAFSCSCAPTPIDRHIEASDGVYVARARLPDVWSGVSFRVLRVLKGDARSNIRVTTEEFGSSCGTAIAGADWVVTTHGDARPHLGLCNDELRGPTAIAAAERLLGQGRAPPWRPDLLWLSQWLLLGAIVAGAIFWLIRREPWWKERWLAPPGA